MTATPNLTRTMRRSALLFAVLSVVAGGGHDAFGQTDAAIKLAVAAGQNNRAMKVELNKSRLIELPRDVGEVIISNPAVVEAVVRTPRRVHLLGQQIGEASAVFVGRDGTRLLALDITVERDLAPIAGAIRRLIPSANVRLESVNDNIVLTGTAPPRCLARGGHRCAFHAQARAGPQYAECRGQGAGAPEGDSRRSEPQRDPQARR
jgi:pilus assembly protein CpaC